LPLLERKPPATPADGYGGAGNRLSGFIETLRRLGPSARPIKGFVDPARPLTIFPPPFAFSPRAPVAEW
jgi:hypothetical protein